jgi:hypothetical protein
LAVSQLFTSPIYAEVKLLTVNLNTEKNQSFASLMSKAELAANNSITQQFNQSTVTEVGITVVGERNGQAVPLLFTRVSRADWQAQPKIKSWTKYFTKAAILLGFNLPQKIKPPAPTSSTNISAKESDPGFRDD